MFHSPQQDKDDFYAGLQGLIDQVSEQDILVVMGDWNARVGSSQEGQLGPPCLKTNPSPLCSLGHGELALPYRSMVLLLDPH